MQSNGYGVGRVTETWCTQVEHGPGWLQGVLRRASREEEQELESVWSSFSAQSCCVSVKMHS